MKIQEQKIRDFLDSVASSKPTPGGGSVAAVTGAMAASLVEMVCALTIGKKNYVEVEGVAKEIKVRAMEIRHELLDSADADTEAFDKVMEAYKSEDKSKIKAALFWAIEVPQRTKDLSEEVQKLAVEMAEIGNKNAYSDAMSADYLANAAMDAATENIEINKKLLLILAEAEKEKV